MQRHGCKIRPFLNLPQDKTHGQVQLPEYHHRRLQLLVSVQGGEVGSGYFWVSSVSYGNVSISSWCTLIHTHETPAAE